MEQLTITATNDKILEILDELMENGKQFQLLITVNDSASSTFSTVKTISSTASVSHSPNADTNLEQEVTKTIQSLGIPAHIKGYQYLRYAIIACIEDPSMISSVTKALYPAIAEKYLTTPSRVERAIRHAIEVAWTKGNISILDTVFGYTVNSGKGKPTNSEFIALLTDRMRLQIRKRSV